MTQVLGVLLPAWETLIELLAPGFGTGLAPVFVGIWAMKQQIGALSGCLVCMCVCVSLYFSNK